MGQEIALPRPLLDTLGQLASLRAYIELPTGDRVDVDLLIRVFPGRQPAINIAFVLPDGDERAGIPSGSSLCIERRARRWWQRPPRGWATAEWSEHPEG